VGWSKLLISVIFLAYIVYLTAGLFFAYLGANPIEVVTHTTGEWGLYFLLMTSAITPLRRHYHWNTLLKFRLFLGLWSFTVIFLHFFIFFDHFFDIGSIVEDIIERPYIAVGFVAFIFMIPLAITSYKALQKRMGKRWISLHQSVYLVGVLGIIHYWWLVKADILWPLVFAVVLAVLLVDRIYW
jgi:sulfoxide reductase heme-binding subunit YedZ